MDHIAILDKKRNLLSKIISGEKTIESRWYKFKKTPYKNIASKDTVYFKDSGEAVTTKAEVEKVLFFDHLNEDKIKQILHEYGQQICIPESYAPELVGKNFCTLIFWKNVQQIVPFNINKKGFGLMAAWITVKDINSIKV